MDTNQHYITNSIGGKIEIEEIKEGFKFFAHNFEHRKKLHIGTVKSKLYEKGSRSILRIPELSICLTENEYGAAVAHGAEHLRCIVDGWTYSISLKDFRRIAKPYFNARYGPQLRCPLSAFQPIHKVSKRNPIVDNPVIEREAELLPQQLGLFR